MYMEKSILELHEMLTSGKVTSAELIKESLEKSHEVQEKCNAFVTILDDAIPSDVTDDLLSGIPYGIKDNYSTKGILTTASSNTLRDYIPFYTATAVENLSKHGAVAVNKTVLDEFGMGATGTTGHTGAVLNPWNRNRMCAGSSAGSACAVASGVYPYALGSDTGDSIRKPAAYCGIVGYKPTYGMISRYGLLPYASSLDTCGVLTRNVKDAAIVVDAMKGKDEHDMTSWDSSNMHLLKSIDGEVKGKKLCYIKELVSLDNYPHANDTLKAHIKNFMEVVEKIKSIGIEVEEVSVDKKIVEAVPNVYNVISYAEATSNMSNLTGISFGPREAGSNYIELMKNYRTNNFSPLIKRRFIIGSYVLQKDNKERYFYNAQKLRRIITNAWLDLFKNYDAVVLPIEAGPANYVDLSKNYNEYDQELVPLHENLQAANLGGFPSIALPDGFVGGMPVGLSLTSKPYDDENMLNIAYAIENTLGYANQIAKENTNE